MTEVTMTTAEGLNGSSTNATKPSVPTHLVSKPTPYTFSPSHLSTTDPNPLPPTSTLLSLARSELNTTLQSTSRDATQSLLAYLLTTTTITSTPDGLTMALPPSDPPLLPRWKPLPKPKAPTKWEAFAKKKGHRQTRRHGEGGAALIEQRKNMVYDEEKGEWVKKWGYKGKNQKDGGEWLVEVDEKRKKVEEEGKSVRGRGRGRRWRG